MAENVKVVVRCRPINNREMEFKSKQIVEIENCCVTLKNPNDHQAPDKQFTYDSAYDSNSTTDSLYNDICFPLVENVLEGYNCTIFAYGQTGCGKTFTMQGIESTKERGVISKTFEQIFESISVTQDVRYLVLVSYLEIYNENIRDLLKPANNNNQQNLQLKELPFGDGILVQNLSQHTVINAKECENLLLLGNKNRSVGGTLMNQGSSRSHSIFTINLEQIKTKDITIDITTATTATTTTTTNNNNNNSELDSKGNGIIKSKLNLVDLAGSERQNKTGAAGDRLKEATKINLSLSALGNVISALVDAKTKHIPYRDSKLTRLLQDSLGGNTKTLMIACISPTSYNYDETLSTLRYASRAKCISNIPKINEDPKDTKLREYQEEILKLKALLESTTTSSNISATTLIQSNDIDQDKLEEERNKLHIKYKSETKQLRDDYENQKKEREELVQDMERLKHHYENQLKNLNIATNLTAEQNNNNNLNQKNSMIHKDNANVVKQEEVLNRIEAIKNALIGGEKANDMKLKEKHLKKRLQAQNRLNSLALALSRIEENSDRDLLQEHYSDIHEELIVKTNVLKQYRFRIKQLELEINDLHSEFQLDRTDYLESIRRLERTLKFYQQLLDKALPILRKDGKYWDPDQLQSISSWNDDLKNWKLPDDEMNRFKLPPTTKPNQNNLSNTEKNIKINNENNDDDSEIIRPDIADSYFQFNNKHLNRNRITTSTSDLIFQHRNGLKNWKEPLTEIIFKQRQQQNNKLKKIFSNPKGQGSNKIEMSKMSNLLNIDSIKSRSLLSLANCNENRNEIDKILLLSSSSSSLIKNDGIPVSRTWSGLSQIHNFDNFIGNDYDLSTNGLTHKILLQKSPMSLLPIKSNDSLIQDDTKKIIYN